MRQQRIARYRGRCALVLAASTAWWLVALAAPAQASGSELDDLVRVVEDGLRSWEQYANEGQQSDLSWLVKGGPQWIQLTSEVPIEAPRLHLEINEIRVRDLRGDSAVVWAEVEARRQGHHSATWRWDFELVFTESEWLVWTVVAAERPSTVPDTTTSIQPTTTSLPPSSTSSHTASDEDDDDALIHFGADVVERGRGGTRIPAISAWVIVVTVAGVAAAGYMAPRIDRRNGP